jgi:hypothetical protein
MRKSAGEFLSGWTLHCGLWWEERELRLDRIPWKGPFNQHRNGRGGEGLDYQLDMVRHGFVSRNPAPVDKDFTREPVDQLAHFSMWQSAQCEQVVLQKKDGKLTCISYVAWLVFPAFLVFVVGISKD